MTANILYNRLKMGHVTVNAALNHQPEALLEDVLELLGAEIARREADPLLSAHDLEQISVTISHRLGWYVPVSRASKSAFGGRWEGPMRREQALKLGSPFAVITRA